MSTPSRSSPTTSQHVTMSSFLDENDREHLKQIARPFTNLREDVGKKEIPESARTVLLGECTHGTEEFYAQRAELSKYLIEVKGYKIILCEADWTFMWHVNQYIHRKRSKMFPEHMRFPQWMWKNKPFYDLVEWMRKRASSDGPYIFGLDCYCKDESREEVVKFFDFFARDTLGKQFRQTLYPVERPELWPQVLSKLQWEIEEDEGKNTLEEGIVYKLLTLPLTL
jgi:hypothetical protein